MELISLGTALTIGTKAYKEYRRRQIKEIREIIFSEMRAGDENIFAEDPDELFMIMDSFITAKLHGAARINLKLMAKLLAGYSTNGVLHAAPFLKHAKNLASLSQEEIIFLAAYIKQTQHAAINRQDKSFGSAEKIWDATIKDLVPLYFKSDEEVRGIAYALQRTGLLIARPSIDETGYLVLSPLAFEIEKMASFESVLDEEEAF